jgi:predicted exporter
MTTHGFGRGWRIAPWLWLACVLAVGAHQWRFWQQDRLETDLFALLPQDEREAAGERAMRSLADRAARQIVVLVGAPSWEAVRQAAERFDAQWRAGDARLEAEPAFDAAAAGRAVAALRPWRDRLLLPEQRTLLRESTPQALHDRALAALHQPGGGPRLTDWAADPLGLWPAWWLQRAAANPLRPREGWLWLQADGLEWVMLVRRVVGPAFSIRGDTPHGDAIDVAERELLGAMPAAVVLRAGVPLHAEAAAAQGMAEANLIGWGSLAAVLALVWLGFRSLRPIACVALSLVVGVAAALSVTAVVFGTVHLVTLVFGASLVGVAEDFGIHFFASRAAVPRDDPHRLMRRLLPGLALALATSVVGYALMAAVPFPGLRQMALFSAVGLLAAFLTVACWFPALAGTQRPMTPLAGRIAASIRWRPTLPRSWAVRALWAAIALGIVIGCARLTARDDVRLLQSGSAPLLEQQRQVQQLLRWPSPGQFFVVAAPDEATLLEREQRLAAALVPLQAQGVIGGTRALSDWVPPPARQHEAAALTAQAEGELLAALGHSLGEDFVRPAFAPAPLTLSEFVALPAAAALRGQWLGDIGGGEVGSVVLVSGIESAAQLPLLARAAEGLPGVRWVDQVGNWSELLARYRVAMGAVLVAGFVAVGLVLWVRYRHEAWRAWLPSALACVLALGVQGWLAEPLQLFNVLALIILLGIGVDYGILLVEHRADGSAWLAVVLGAASTLLSFGLLALSATPALSGFGTTMAIGLVAVVGLSAALAPPARGPR